ncbi:MAG: hypothetical protein WCE94_11745 [Candidatus Methanoperedens sp.]
MADLSDFLGHILEEITRARVQADSAAIRTAKLYASDKDGFLKHFPVPRMRLPNIEITAPVVIIDIPEGYMEKTDPNLLSQSVADDVLKILTKKKISLDIAEITNIIKEDESLSKGYLSETSADVLSGKIGTQIKTMATKTISSADVHKKVVSLIHDQIFKTFQLLPRKPMGIVINAKTSAIKELSQTAGQGANVVYFKMSITEDAMEIELKDPSEPVSDGQSNIKRLIPE